MIFNISNCKYLIVVNVKSGNTRQLSDFSSFFVTSDYNDRLFSTQYSFSHLKSKLNHEPVAVITH